MSISLLYRDRSAMNEIGTIGKDTLDQLALRRFTDKLGLTARDAEYFHDVLSKPLTNANDIAYRRAILECFVKHPSLLAELDERFDKLFELRLDYNDLKKEKRQLLRSSPKEGNPDAAKNLLVSAGLTLKRCLLFLEAITHTLRAHPLDAEGLRLLLDELQAITSGDAFGEMIVLLTRFETYSEVSGTAVRLKLTELGSLVACDLTDRQRILFRKPEPKKKRFLFAKKEEIDNPPAAPINLTFCTLQTTLRSNAMISLSEQADAIAGGLFDRFLSVGRELTFYRVALSYVHLLSEKSAPICYAEFGKDGQFSFDGLYDPLLVQSRDKLDEVVPNTLEATAASGIALFGENGSGKTVWLRSVGLAQLFTQAGLPVPAKSAEFWLYRQIFTHFSSGEKEFEAGNEAGRFEQEVREMASILDQIGENGLILLNETFQTTAYEEGAEGLSHILRYLTEGGSRWMLTTHLTPLPRFFGEGELAIYRTDSLHRVLPVKEIDPLT